jgi:hypothetical protein
MWSLIHYSPGPHTSSCWKRRQLKYWTHFVTPLTGEVACLSQKRKQFYKHLIRPILEYASQLLRPEVASITIQMSLHCDWRNIIFGKMKVQEDFGIPFYADHIRALSESFHRTFSDAGRPFVLQFWRHCADRGLPDVYHVNRGTVMLERPVEAVQKEGQISSTNSICSLGYPEIFRDFSQLEGRYHGIIHKEHVPATPDMEAFRLNDSPIPLQ